MDMKRVLWFGLIYCNILNPAYATTLMLYGLDSQHDRVMSHPSGTHYQLQVNSFSNRQNAIAYRKKIAGLTSFPVHVVAANGVKNRYQVVVGPLSGWQEVQRVRVQLSRTQSPAKFAAEKPVVKTVRLEHAKFTQALPSPKKQVIFKENHPKVILASGKDTRTSFTMGPYVAGSVGAKVNVTGNPAAYEGVEGTLAGGFGHIWRQRYYLGAEAFGGDSFKIRDYKTSSSSSTGVMTSWSYGLDVLPGLMVTDDVLAYLRTGPVRSRFVDVKGESTAWQWGLGGETNIYGSLDLRAEYIFSLYKALNNLGKPQVHQFNLGVVKKIQ